MSRLERVESVAGIALTAVALYLHLRYATHAGPLWRDECNTVAVATKPTWKALVGALEHESFPILSFAVVRGWAAVGGGSDLGLRILGFLVGAGILGALWVAAAATGARVPLLSLCLFALNPVVIRWGDSLRAYGMGTLLFLLLFAVLFRTCRRGGRSVLVAALALLAVQCMYQNALLLLAGAGAMVLASERGRRARVAASVCAVGAGAAISLLPYLGIIARARDHFAVITMPPEPSRIWNTLVEAISGFEGGMGLAGLLHAWAWLLLYAAAVVLGAVFLVLHRKEPHERSAACRYGVVLLLLSPLLIFAFLLRLSFRTEPWYFVLLLGAVAASLDTVYGSVARGTIARVARIAVACGLAALSVLPVHALLEPRQTNVDLAAAELARRAGPQDLIVVDPWFYGVSFQRYARGRTPWMTLPPVADHEIHRFDLVKRQMMLADPALPIRERAGSTLRAGHVVWVLGILHIPEQPREKLPPPPGGPDGWYSDPYLLQWRNEVGSFLRNNAAQGEGVPIPTTAPIGPYEDLLLWRVEGWVGPG